MKTAKMNRTFAVCLVFVAAGLLATSLAQDEEWRFVEQPRCCSDCTFVRGRFKCKVKSCLSKCPFPRKYAAPFQEPQPEEDEEEEERKQNEERNHEIQMLEIIHETETRQRDVQGYSNGSSINIE